MSTIAEQLQEAADKASQASAQAGLWATGPVGTTVPTDSGPVPTISEFTRAAQERADDAIDALGWVLAGDFTAGCTVTDRNQYVLVVGGPGYRWDGVLPKVVAPGSSPTPIATGAWVLVGDATLRGDLAAAGGSELVGIGGGRTQADKNRVVGDSAAYADLSGAILDLASNQTHVVVNNTAGFTITVGPGGQVATVNAALSIADRMKKKFSGEPLSCTVMLKSGFELSEQVLIKNGIDFGWVVIKAEDPVVRVNHLSISEYLSTLDDSRPAFGAKDNSALPVIGCLLSYDSNAVAYDGVAALYGSKASFLPGAGVRKCRRGIHVLYQSSAYCYMPGLPIGGSGSGAGTVMGVDFSQARLRALHVGFNSIAGLARSDFTYCEGDAAVYVIWASVVDVYQSKAHHCSGTAMYVRDGSTCSARETDVSYSNRGYHALHNSRINARAKESASSVPWTGDSAKNCTEYGVMCTYNSAIDATEVDVSGSGIGVHAFAASSVSFNFGTAIGCLNYGVYAAASSLIDCTSVNASNAVNFGFYCTQGSTISADSSKADGCKKGYNASESSIINARLSTANGCTEHGYYALRGSRINCRSSTIAGAVVGVYAEERSDVNAQSVGITGTVSSFGYQVTRGSFINAGSATGSLSTAANVLTSAGAIFQ